MEMTCKFSFINIWSDKGHDSLNMHSNKLTRAHLICICIHFLLSEEPLTYMYSYIIKIDYDSYSSSHSSLFPCTLSLLAHGCRKSYHSKVFSYIFPLNIWEITKIFENETSQACSIEDDTRNCLINVQCYCITAY